MRGGLGSRFWTLWTALAGANLADGVTLIAFPLLAVNLTDDARLIALVSAVRILPFPLIGLPAGVVIDRSDRRRLAVAAQAVRTIAIAVLAALVVTGSASIGLLCVVAFLTGAGEVFIDGGLPAIVRSVVTRDQLEVANSRLAVAITVTNYFVGPPLSALLFGIDPSAPFFLAVGLYVVAMALMLALPGSFRPPADDERASMGRRLVRGLSYVWGHPVLRPLALAVAVFAFVGEAGNAVHVILITQRLGISELGYGLIVTVDAVVSIVTSFYVARLVRRTSHGTSMQVSVVTYAIAALLYGTAGGVPVVVLAAVFAGLSDPTWNVISSTVRQRLVPDEIFGRMMTAYLVIAWGMQPLGAMAGGFVAERWGSHTVFIVAGLTVGSLMIGARGMFRAVDAAMGSSAKSSPSAGAGD